jgi:hypothetical protein
VTIRIANAHPDRHHQGMHDDMPFKMTVISLGLLTVIAVALVAFVR